MSEDIREASWQAYREKMHALDAANDLAGRGLIPSYRDWHAGWDAAQQALAAHSGQPRLLAAVESVLALHTPATRYTAAGWEEASFESRVDAAEYGDTDDVKEFTVCHECGLIETHDGGEERCYEYSIWPCATVRSITEALEGDTDAE